MGICSKCGNPVEFRYVRGRCIPMHFDGGCIGSSSRVNDYSNYNTADESTCFGTTCPECGDAVFFVRHNGGSVWLDPPLGWPWYKHGCFYSEERVSGVFESALVTNQEAEDLKKHANAEIGIVKRTWVEPNRNYTDIVLDLGRQDTDELRVKNNAGFLLGKLCVLDREKESIWPFYEPEYVFILYDPEKHTYVVPPPIVKTDKKVTKRKLSREKLVQCSICNCKILKKKLRKHMRKVHSNANM